ncbi:MAG: zinc-ribbon domain-containing protein, partial [Lachnospiraceae bacterium]|nr:zinc-ribbon domain-containing protein [Lachnospiraceae bacterium]
MYCTKCGRENEEGVKFCSYCGAMMETPLQADNAAPVNDNAEAVPEAAPSLQSGPPEISGQPEVSVQPGALGQPETAEQPKAPEQPKAQGQPWMDSQPKVVEQSWMAGQAVGTASVQMPNVVQANVPPVQVPQAAQTNVSPGQMGQMPPMAGQAPQQSGQMPPMAGQTPIQNGQMPSMAGQMPMQGGQIPPINGQIPPMPYSAVPPANPSQKKGNGAVKAILGIMIVLVLVGIGAAAFLFINKSSQEKKLQNQLETAANYIADGSYEEAVAAYLEILEKNPENSEAIDGLTDTYIKWAERYANDENYEEAIAILQSADDQAKSKTIKKKISEYEDTLAAMNQKGFADTDLIFRDGTYELTVELNHALIVRPSGTYYTSYADASYEEYGEYATDRGLKLGDSLEDYRTLYEVEPGYSAWELYSGENNEYTSFAEYTGQSPADMYNNYKNVWLDIGFSKENGEWRALTDIEIKETWFCDAPLYDYEEVVIFAVNFDEWGEVIGLSLEHFSYDEGWVEWQAWDDGSDSGNDGNGDDDFGYTGNREEFT